MPKDAKTMEKLKVVMSKALLEMKQLIDDDPNQKEVDFVPLASIFLHSVISTAADLAELHCPGSGPRLYADIEAGTKLGGLRAIEKMGLRYSISDIAPDDMETAMNYLGKAMSTALFKEFYELPSTLQNEETLLRAVEALLTNLLGQKFNNPHDILDSFCEHVHMGLGDLEKPARVH